MQKSLKGLGNFNGVHRFVMVPVDTTHEDLRFEFLRGMSSVRIFLGDLPFFTSGFRTPFFAVR